MYWLSDDLTFPPVADTEDDGLLAVGGDLSVERLLLAYRNGIFPWYNENDPVCWWSPDPRCVLFPEKLHVGKMMQKIISAGRFTFCVDQDFEKVMRRCKTVQRKEANGTWIQEEMVVAYTKLHKLGYAQSAECRIQGVLAGGLYGVRIGKVFFGESMFTAITNAGKIAFIKFVQQLREEGVRIIDCQQKTNHLLGFGAEMISRDLFIELLDKYC